MSGLEVVWVVASTFQLAEIGIKLSIKLCSFYRQIKDADHSAQRLASDVSLTCSILHQLGKTLEQDSQTKLCSQQAFLTAQEVLEECEKIFKQIEDAIEKKDPGSGKSKWERGARRLTIVILGPDLDVLKSHLDRLKSTMLLMLNVIMYAREISRTSDHSSLESQRQLIETLLREKTETEARLKRIIKVANTRSGCDREGTLSSSTLIARPDMRAWQQRSAENEIDKYYKLVKSLLDEIDACQTNLQPDRHLRIRDGVVNVHKAELAIFQQSHGEAVVQAFDGPFFKVYNRDLDSSFVSKPNSKVPAQKSASTHPYGAHPSSGRRRYPAYDRLKRGDDIEDYDAYSYTTPREQFDRDYPVKPPQPTTRSSLDRPVSITVMDEHPRLLRKQRLEQAHGPQPISRGFDKLKREGRRSSYDSDSHRDTSKTKGGYDRALVALSYESDDGYDSYSDTHRQPRHRRHYRRPRHNKDRSRDNRSLGPHNSSGEQISAVGLGTVTLGAGYSDMLEDDNRPAIDHHRYCRELDRDSDSAQPSSRDFYDNVADKSKPRYLEPGSHHHRRPRRRSRGRDHDSDANTDDEDLRKYRRERVVTPRSRHSSTDISSAEDYSSRRHCEHSHHRSSHSQQMLEDSNSTMSHHSSSIDGEDDTRKVVTAKESEAAPKGILKAPRESFPQEPNPVREGVAPLKDAHKNGIPPGARLTKIDRRLVSPEALEAGNERHEERLDYVIVWRVLSLTELQAYAVKTQEIRDERHKEYIKDTRRRLDEARRHRRREESSSDDEDEGSDKQLKLEAPPSPESKKNSLPVRPRESNKSPTEPERLKRSPEPLKQQKAHSTQDAKRLLTSLPSHASSNSTLEVKQDIQDSQQKEYLRRGILDRDNHREDLPGGKAPACDDEKDDKNEDESMEVDTPTLGQKASDISDFRREITSSGKEGPRKHVASETLEDLVLSWTNLSRDMIQL